LCPIIPGTPDAAEPAVSSSREGGGVGAREPRSRECRRGVGMVGQGPGGSCSNEKLQEAAANLNLFSEITIF